MSTSQRADDVVLVDPVGPDVAPPLAVVAAPERRATTMTREGAS